MDHVPIGVAIVNWKRPGETIACLESLRAAVPAPARVVVVDNASSDGSLEALQHWAADHPDLPLGIIQSEANRGFAGGNNLGIAQLAQDPRLGHFLLLNNDATVAADFFAEATRAIGEVPHAGLLGATIYEGTTRNRVWYAGGRLPRLRALATHNTRVPPHAVVVPTEFVTGCAMLISRVAWAMLGPLPERYFMYFEDTEYSFRARAAGFPVLYAPRVVVHHAVAGAERRSLPRAEAEYLFTRGRVLFVRRNLRGWRRSGALSYVVLTRVVRAFSAALTGRPRLAWALLRGAIDGFVLEATRPY